MPETTLEPMRPHSMYFPPDLWRDLSDAAHYLDTNASAIIRRLVEEWLAEVFMVKP